MLKAFLICAAVALLIVAAVRVEVGPPRASATSVVVMTSGDSTVAAAGSFMIYPFFSNGGGHIHNSQWVVSTDGFPLNGFSRATLGGYLFSRQSDVRVNVYGSADTSGFTVPAGATQTRLPACDSVKVLNLGGQTTVTWGLYQ